MSFKLSDKQRELLSAAAEREDRLLPSQLKSGAAQKVAAKLVAAGLAKEVKAKTGAPIWRRDEATEQAYALKLTAAGSNAVEAHGKIESEMVGATVSAPSPDDRPARQASRARSDVSAITLFHGLARPLFDGLSGGWADHAPTRSSMPSCSRPSRTLRAADAVARSRAILEPIDLH